MNTATIMILAPRKPNDATVWTYDWAQKTIKMAKNLGYNVVSIEKDATTYDNVTKSIQKYQPRLLASFSHGCQSSLNGQKECMITRKYEINELMEMEPEILSSLLNPVKLSGCTKEICGLQDSVCLPLCFNPTNIHLLKGTIVISVACHTSRHLGRCAVAYGATTYLGYSDLLLFPVDTMQSQDMFGDIHIQLMKNILMGDSVGEAYNKIMKMEDSYIRMYKSVKWVGLPLLWNHKHRELLGDKSATVY